MRQMWGSSKVRKQHYERAQTEGPNGFENTHRGGKYVYFPITTSYLSPLFPDTLSLRYILFPSPPPARVCMFSESTPQTVPQIAVSLLHFNHPWQKNWRIWTSDPSPPLDMPFNTHHFNGLTESFYTALHCINMWAHTHTHTHTPPELSPTQRNKFLLRGTNIPHDVNWRQRSIYQDSNNELIQDCLKRKYFRIQQQLT